MAPDQTKFNQKLHFMSVQKGYEMQRALRTG